MQTRGGHVERHCRHPGDVQKVREPPCRPQRERGTAWWSMNTLRDEPQPCRRSQLDPNLCFRGGEGVTLEGKAESLHLA